MPHKMRDLTIISLHIQILAMLPLDLLKKLLGLPVEIYSSSILEKGNFFHFTSVCLDSLLENNAISVLLINTGRKKW